MYGCESWTLKKAACWRIDAFELWCWRRLLRVSWTARRSNQSILKEISPGCSLEGLMLKLKYQYFGHLIQKADSLEKSLMLGKIERRRRRGRQRMRWLDGITDSLDMGLGVIRVLVMDREAWHSVVHGVAESRTYERLKWTECITMSYNETQVSTGSQIFCHLGPSFFSPVYIIFSMVMSFFWLLCPAAFPPVSFPSLLSWEENVLLQFCLTWKPSYFIIL